MNCPLANDANRQKFKSISMKFYAHDKICLCCPTKKKKNHILQLPPWQESFKIVNTRLFVCFRSGCDFYNSYG